MRTIKVNVHDQRKRFRQLLDALVSNDPVDGCYVTGYTELKELGEIYANFTVCTAEDNVPYFDFDASQGKPEQSAT